MLEQVGRFIGEGFISLLGFYVLKKLLNKDTKLLSMKTTILLLVLTIIPTILYKVQYHYSYTLIVYLLAIVTYKLIFNENIYKTIISTGIFFLLLLGSDIIVSMLLLLFVEGTASRDCWYMFLIANVLVDLLVILLINISALQHLLEKFISKVSKSKFLPRATFLSASIIVISIYGMGYNTLYNRSLEILLNSTIMLLMIMLSYIFIQDKINYDKLSSEYEALYKYVQVFENWIENEQLTRHEYKNQLAVIRAMTKEKKVKQKIDSLIETTINLNNDMIETLKYIPNGGLKGLLYYKIAIASNKKINITIDISREVHKSLKKLNEVQIKDLSNVLGIYLDNAIEATQNIRKRKIALEIYQINNEINFVISNTYNKKSITSNNVEKGISSKGKNRGNGLYFAKKIIDKNKMMRQEQTIIENYYIQKLLLKFA